MCGAQDLDEKKARCSACPRPARGAWGHFTAPGRPSVSGTTPAGEDGPSRPSSGPTRGPAAAKAENRPRAGLVARILGSQPCSPGRGKGDLRGPTVPSHAGPPSPAPGPVPPPRPRPESRSARPGGGGRGARTPGLGRGLRARGRGFQFWGAGTPGFRAGFGRRPQSRLLRGPGGLAALPAESLLAAARGYPVSAALRPMSPGWGARRGRPGAPRARGRVRGGGGPGLREPGGAERTRKGRQDWGSRGWSARPGSGERDGDTPRPGAWRPVAQVALGPAPTGPLPTPTSDGKAPGGSSPACL